MRELEALLHDSHDARAFVALREFAGRLKKRRQEVFSTPGALLVRPIDCSVARADGLWPADDDDFSHLQGDIVFTSAAYFMGQRVEEGYFALANSTCDLTPNRRAYAALCPVRAVTTPETPEDESRVRSLLGEPLSFKSSQRMYLPPLPNDAENVLARFIDFDGIAQARLEDVTNGYRIASLSLVGWRIFGALLRNTLTRTGDNEIALRKKWR